MTAPDFLDTNILIYAFDKGDPDKRRLAQDLLRRALLGHMVISTQVLAEFAATMLHKLSPAASPQQVSAILDSLAPIKLIIPDGDIVRRAVEVRARYGLHFYDGMVVAAAERGGGCGRIWSEDLNSGQKYFQIVVENPFK
jgi:predicted nucleic acid-binding protein